MEYQSRVRHSVGADDLAWMASVLWPERPGRQTSPIRCRVLPSAIRPWVVVPVLSRRATVRALLDRFRLHPRRQLAIRLIGAGQVVARPFTRAAEVRLDEGFGSSPGVVSLASARLGCRVSPVVALGERHPLRKPTLQLVDDRGRTRGFAKIGWNEATVRLVRSEGETLAAIRARLTPAASFATPEVLLSAAVPDLGLQVLLTAPMPRTARMWRLDRLPPDPLLEAVADAVAGPAGTRTEPVSGLRLWTDLRQRSMALAEARDSTTARALLDVLEMTLAALPRADVCRVAGWHGDFAPWNMSVADDTVFIWDWEHAAPDRPVGFDLLHFGFAVDRHARRRSSDESVAALRDAAVVALPRLGVPRTAVDAIVLGYLIERWLRDVASQSSGPPQDPTVDAAGVARLARGWLA